MDGYTILEIYCHGLSSSEQRRAEDFLESIGMEFDYENGFSPDGEYYIEYVDSQHERCSSGDIVRVFQKK